MLNCIVSLHAIILSTSQLGVFEGNYFYSRCRIDVNTFSLSSYLYRYALNNTATNVQFFWSKAAINFKKLSVIERTITISLLHWAGFCSKHLFPKSSIYIPHPLIVLQVVIFDFKLPQPNTDTISQYIEFLKIYIVYYPLKMIDIPDQLIHFP